MQNLTYVVLINPAPLLREETVLAKCVVNSQFRSCTSLISRQVIVVFGLGTRLYMRMRTNQKMASFVTDSNHSVVNGFY